MSGDFILIDSVNVNESDFQYTDEGQLKAGKLVRDQIYYYKVLTRGSYGNPEINSPLENFSQISGTEVRDTIPPCKPVMHVSKTDCNAFDCDESSYFNNLTWENPEIGCPTDVEQYELLARHDAEEFASLGIFEDNFFTHNNLNSLAKCYRLIAIDDAGNKSDSSEVVCNENCPHFELPNVFTPENVDGLNDVLTTYTDPHNVLQCPRFVKQVNLKIYDRWGLEVYSSISGPESNYLFWNGVSSAGKEVSAGVYYFLADVHFTMRDPAQSVQQIKGVIHVIR